MKTLKLSLSALAALCYLVLFMTGCQDDAVENDLQPSLETDQVSDIQLMLEAVLNDASLDEPTSNARLAGAVPVSYDVSITTSTFSFATEQAGKVIRKLDGTLELVPVDKIPDLNVIVAGQEFQLYSGTFTFVNAKEKTVKRRAAAIVLEDGTSYLLLRNIPSAGNVFTSAFVLEDDFSVEGFVTRNQQGRLVSVAIEADFIEPDAPEETETITTYVYDLLVTVRERVETNQDTIDSPAGPIPIVNTELDTLTQLDGELEVIVGDDGNISGRYNFTTAAGINGSARVKGSFTDEENTLLIDIFNISEVEIPEPGVSEISIAYFPIGEEGSDFTLVGFGEDEAGEFLDDVTVVGSITDVVVVEVPA